jgi:hypothetical protein
MSKFGEPGSGSNNASHGDVYYIAASPPFRSRACLAALNYSSGTDNDSKDRIYR